jgi:hypothetical protein
MHPKPSNANSATVRRPARDVIDAVLENMRNNLEPLKYSTLAPSRYVVYLHPNEYARLAGIAPVIQEQAIRALMEELGARNRRSVVGRYARRILGDRTPHIENPAGEWSVELFPDPDGDIAEGDIVVDSELHLPDSPQLSSGERTRRVTTVHSTPMTTSRRRIAFADSAKATPLARIEYEDNAGHHSYDVKDSVTIGRGGVAYPVDIKITSSVDVSREHARIRRDLQTGKFFLIDLSTLGTTLDGRYVPRGYDDAGGTKKENGAETLIPDRARIGLAETVYLEFHLVHQ